MDTAEEPGRASGQEDNESLPHVTWWNYFNRVIGDTEVLSHVADKLEINRSSISRWRTSRPDMVTVRKFSKAYDRPVIECYIAAGFLTPDDFLSEISTLDLALVLVRRLEKSADGRKTGVDWELLDYPRSFTIEMKYRKRDAANRIDTDAEESE